MKIEFLNVSHGIEYKLLGSALGAELRQIKSRSAAIVVKVSRQPPPSDGSHPKMHKLAFVLSQLERNNLKVGDWVVWVDSDMAILDWSRDPATILPAGKDLVFSADKFGICTGVFAVRKVPWTRDFFRAIILLGFTDPERRYEFDPYSYRWEQFLVRTILRYFPAVRAHCGIFPESLIQNRMSEYSPSAWLFHFWMGGRTATEILSKKKMLRHNRWSKKAFWEAGRFDVQTWRDAVGVAAKIGIRNDDMAVRIGFARACVSCGLAKRLSPRQSDRLIRLSNLGDEAMRAIPQRRDALRWLRTPQKALRGDAPLDLAADGRNYAKAQRALLRISPLNLSELILKGS